MPEGHTLHRLARDLGADLRGRQVSASSPQGRFEQAAAVDGTQVVDVDAYGKHLLLDVSVPASVHVHLGMQGRWLRYDDPSVPPLRQVRLRLATTEVAWDLIAPSRCELLTAAEVERLLSRLGPDPLRPDADPGLAVAALAAAPGPIGAALLDQAVVAGVGNVFRSEALHELGIAPSRPCRELGREQLDALWAVLCRMMARAVEDGRIVTVDGPDRLQLPEAETRRVYRQERCRDCGAAVVTSTVGGRIAYHCPVEQPER
jgi:endonuclease-8